jgi:hypothetical protein
MKKKLTILFLIFSTYIIVGQKTVDTKALGQSILDGKIKYTGTNDEMFFPVLDSLLGKYPHDWVFYFNVANKIQQFSDGALSEHVSTVFSDYYFNEGDHFIDHSRMLSKQEIYKWLDYIAFDLYADSKNGKKDLPVIRSKMKALEKKYPNDAWILKKYNDYLYQKAETLIKAK